MNFNFKKKYGQNFLINNKIIDDIINTVEIKENDLVIEIGPGSGALTKKIKKFNPYLLCYEIDLDTKIFLDKLVDNKTKIIYDDFLKRDVLKDIDEYDYDNLYIMSNLPYYITTPIILKIIDEFIPVKTLVLMVQKEVADRFCAKPKSREYGSITVLLNAYFELTKCFIVSKNNFKPAPNVESAVIKLVKKEKLDIDIKKFNLIIKSSFQMKRKNLKNNLKNYDLEKINEVLKKYGYDLSNRAEDLPLEVFIELSKL